MQVLMVVTIVQYEAPSYGSYQYPGWALACGWAITSSSMTVIPAWALFMLLRRGLGRV